jgi:predicted phage terminase large subunit-like protein
MELFLLDQVHDRLSFTATCAALREMAAKWPQATLKLVEDKANGTAVINSLSRQVPGLIPVEPDGSKEARARAVTPFIEAGSIYLPAPEVCPWVGDFIQEHSGFPNGSHDDQVDACTQAINRMLLAPILAGTLIVDATELDDELDGWEISPY